MNLPILLIFGIVNTVCAIYKIPEHDACVLKVLLCDDFTKPLTPVDNSTLEMFKSIGQVNAVCDELSKFRNCLKNAEIFCTENANLDVGYELLNNRRLAFDLCERNSAHQHVYMMVEECVNKYSHSAIEFCTDKAVETVGLDFYLGDYESECRFLGAIQHCHIAVVTDRCGSIAGNMLEKLVVFRGERDFMCIGYEKEKLKNLEAFYATMDSYVQQYRNTVYQVETENEAETTDGVGSFKTPPQEASSRFYSRISTVSDESMSSDIDHTNNREPLNLEVFYYPEQQPLSTLSEGRLDSEYTAHNKAHTRRFYEQGTDKISDENRACKTKELNRAHSTSRIGLLSYAHRYGTIRQLSKIADHKRNFYEPEQYEYPIDTEIHLISSEEGNLENGFEVGDNYASQNRDDNLDLFLRDEILNEKNYELSTSAPPKSPFHSYRPYEMYRPRVGETLEAENHKSREDMRIKDAEESSFNRNAKNGYTNHLYAEEMCPELPENISKLVNKPGRYSRVDFMNLADPMDVKLKPTKLSFSKDEKDIPSSNMIWTAEEHEISDSDIKQNQYKDVYVVTPSTEIEMLSIPNWTMDETGDIQNLDENSQILNKKDVSQEFLEVPQENNSKDLRIEDITKAMNDKGSGELVSDYPNDKHPLSEKNEFSTNSESFSERSGQKYSTEVEEKSALKMLKLLEKIKFDMMKMLKILQGNNTSLKKLEL